MMSNENYETNERLKPSKKIHSTCVTYTFFGLLLFHKKIRRPREERFHAKSMMRTKANERLKDTLTMYRLCF